MSNSKQIFQTNSKWRWRTFQWSGRLIIFLVLLIIPVIFITLARGIKPGLPLLAGDDTSGYLKNPVTPLGLSPSEQKKYTGFTKFLAAKEKIEKLKSYKPGINISEIRAAFYVDWDPQSFYSLQKNIGKLNMVIPEWFFIDPTADTLKPNIDIDALRVMKKSSVKIIPLINNINPKKGVGEFDGSVIHRIFHNKQKKERLINDIVKYITQYGLQGINIDFEEFEEKGDEPIIAFQKELYERLHPLGYMVTQDIMPYNEDFNVKALSEYNDYMFLMAYDEHYSTSIPGPISSQQWIEKVLDETAKEIPSGKIIMCFAGYGYDWPQNRTATTVTYQQALAGAKQYGASIDFDNHNYNNNYSYKDGDSLQHQVCFTDAASNFNTIRFADEYGTAGVALWRLGSEDERLWSFYNRSLTNQSLDADPFDFGKLKSVLTPVQKPDYLGDGEILNVITKPEPGIINLEVDTAGAIIAEQKYVQLPTKYVIKKYGNVHKQVLLTFDDGPDPEYTPQILDILKKEKVPAAFFVIGMEAENNLPLLKRIYNDGYEIGNHTFTHPNMAIVSADRASTEMESTRLLIEAATGRSTVLFRAPYNADSEPSTEAELKPIALSKQQNYYTVGESIDPEDWQKNITADSIYDRTVRLYERNPDKGIILLHDAGGNRQATVDALPRIIAYFKQRGIAFTTVASLLHTTKDVVMPPVHSNLVSINSQIASFGYWFEQFLTTAFWVAIFLGFIRIAVLAVMAGMQKIKTSRQAPVIFAPGKEVQPKVSIIVPAYNEEVNAVKTVENLLQQNYPFFDIIFVDDGSKDHTFKNVSEAFAGDEKVKVYTKPNGGKASALNFGLNQTLNEFVVCIDADTQLNEDAVLQLMKKFNVPQKNNTITGAVAGYVKVGNETSILTKWQSIEYTTAQNFDRQAFDLVNGIAVVPGAIGAFRKEAIEKAGGFTTDTLAEDCDLTIRILRCGYHVANCAEAIAITEAPETLKQFMKQRFRWSYGIMQSFFWKNREACFNPKYKALGMLALPNVLIFQILLPIIAPLADLMVIVSLIFNRNNPDSLHKIELYYLVFMAVDVLVSVIAFIFAKEKMSKLFWLIPQRFVYRQLMYIILFKAIRKAIKGETQSWGILNRTGNVRQVIMKSPQ